MLSFHDDCLRSSWLNPGKENLPSKSTVEIEQLQSIVHDIRQMNEQRLVIRDEHLPTVDRSRALQQRVDKVSDLEIVKQGNGFKIGYVDRQGTDQRVILTKRIEARPDVMKRDPHIRQPYKGRKMLNQTISSVLYTNGFQTIQEDDHFQHRAHDVEVPIIGTDPKHFDEVRRDPLTTPPPLTSHLF